MTPARCQPYSFIRHLAWSILLNHDTERCLVTTFTAYYDASGSEGDKGGVLVVVGLVANVYKWDRFQREWCAVLKKFGVPYFHMKELGEKRKAGTGVYAKWKDDNVTPRLFVQSLSKVLRRQTHKMFCCGTVLEDYQEVNKTYRIREGIGSPYVLTAGACFDMANRWGRKKYPNHPVIHIFEDGDVGQKDFLKLAQRLNRRPYTRPKKDKDTGQWFIPFQGADLVAGAYRHATTIRDIVTQWEDYGEVFLDLANKLAQESKVYNRSALLDRCRADPDKCSKRV